MQLRAFAYMAGAALAICTCGRGVPAAIVLRVKPDSSQVFEPAIAFDSTARKWAAAPCSVGQAQIKPAYAGAQPSFPGLDQINVLLPASLAGSGTVTVQLTVNGQPANPVTIAIK